MKQKKKNLLFVFGTRPEALKLAPLILEAKKQKGWRVWACNTGQHAHMIAPVLQAFGLKVDFDLKVMLKNQELGEITSRILGRMKKVLKTTQPDLLVVQGDTTTAFVVALQAFYEKIKVAHVEAGLRSYQKDRPFPEETNRKLITHLADYHFAPTSKARQNLLREGVEPSQVFVTGNTIVDAVKKLQKSKKKNPLPQRKKKILLTAHRRESFGKPLESICKAVKDLVKAREDIEVLYPVHLNPRVQKTVFKELGKLDKHRVQLVAPLPYPKLLKEMKQSYLILTDSGGIQEEAPSFQKPVLVLRDVTERTEAIHAGCAKLVGTKRSRIVEETLRLIESPRDYQKMVKSKNPFGDGKASEKIVKILTQVLP